MQLTRAKCRHKNSVSLSFMKPLTHKTDKVTDLAQEACSEFFDKEFNDFYSSSVKDLSTSAVANELNVEKVECTCINVIKRVLVMLEN